MSSANEPLKPYRVEWRPNLVTGWTLIDSFEKHEDGLAELEAVIERWKGQARMISQHVVETRGLGAGT